MQNTRRIFRTEIQATQQELWEFHADVKALKLLAPPGAVVEILGPETEVKEGAVHRLLIKRMGLPLKWDARIHDVTPPEGFSDTAVKSPFAFWTHRHAFLHENGKTVLEDRIEYKLPLGILGRWIDRLFVSKDIEKMFEHRHKVTENYFASNSK